MDFLVVIPTYNEMENLAAIISAVLGQGERFGVLVVDDNSPDGTGRLADQLAAAEPRLMVRHRQKKAGLGPAYVDGFTHGLGNTRARFLISMDADFSHDPAYLPRMADLAESGADVVVGSRYCRGGGVKDWSLGRRLVSRLGGLYARMLLGPGLTSDPTGGFTLYGRQVLESISLAGVQANGYGFQIEMKHRASRAGFRVAELPIVFPDRRQGTSKMSPGIALEAFGLVLKLALRRRA